VLRLASVWCTVWFQLILVAVLILVNAAFAGTEMALVSLREGQLQQLEQRSAAGALVVRLSKEPTRFLATIQVGITLAGFLASASAAVSLAKPIEDRLEFLDGAAEAVSIVIVTLILAYFTLVFGELAPKRIAMQRAEGWALVMARPLQALATLARPAVWLLSKSTDIAVRLLGGDPAVQREEITEDELRGMVAGHDTFTPEQRKVIDGAFRIADRQLDEVLVPRGDVFTLDAGAPIEDAREALRESGHTRAPVAPDANLDKVVGAVHLRDLLGPEAEAATTAADLAVELLVLPEPARVLTALREMQQRRVQMALVVDEHGGIVGIVTAEDLVEELVGEIYDETDTEREGVLHEPDGTVVLPGRFAIHDLDTLGIELPEGDYVTIAGFVLDELGRFPAVGEQIAVDGWRLTVREIDEVMVTRVAIVAVDETGEDGAAQPADDSDSSSNRLTTTEL
jgi:putative hemolysin